MYHRLISLLRDADKEVIFANPNALIDEILAELSELTKLGLFSYSDERPEPKLLAAYYECDKSKKFEDANELILELACIYKKASKTAKTKRQEAAK